MLRFPLQDGKVGLVWVFPYLDASTAMKLNLQLTRLLECGKHDQCRYSHWIIEIRVASAKCEKRPSMSWCPCNYWMVEWIIPPTTFCWNPLVPIISYPYIVHSLVLLYISCHRVYDHPGLQKNLNSARVKLDIGEWAQTPLYIMLVCL